MTDSTVTGGVDAVSAGASGTDATGGKRKGPKNWRPFLLLIPAFVIVSLFFLAPLIDVFIRSVTDPQPGLQNYVWLFTTEANLNVVIRTFGTAILVTIVCLLLAYRCGRRSWCARSRGWCCCRTPARSTGCSRPGSGSARSR
jgi:putative spermidine/putrescine transport system permease protein